MGRTVKEASAGKRISEKTVRATYWKFRETLLIAAVAEPQSFGNAGWFLFSDRRLSKVGKAFLGTVALSNLFGDHLRQHCPRLKSLRQRRLVLLEVVVRIFCNIVMPEGPATLLSLKTRSGEHRFPGNVLYEHLRRYLLKHPL